MADAKDIQEKTGGNERYVSPQERASRWKETEPVKEKKEVSERETKVREEIMREIEMMEMDDNLKKEAEEKVKKIHFLAEDDKLKKLLEIAGEKGVLFAVKVAKSMNDPFLLDTLHDILAREGYYQKFMK